MKSVNFTTGDCLKCGKITGEEIKFECPECNFRFCIRCFKPIINGDGSTIKCPNCERDLILPPMSQSENSY